MSSVKAKEEVPGVVKSGKGERNALFPSPPPTASLQMKRRVRRTTMMWRPALPSSFVPRS